MDQIKDRLRQWRLKLGLTPAEFANQAGISQNTLKGYELGQRTPGAEALSAIAFTGVSINWLLTGIGEMQITTTGATPPTLYRRFESWVSNPANNTQNMDAYPATEAGAKACLLDALWNSYQQGYATCQADARIAIQGLLPAADKAGL